jgi:hypothetical protein
MALPTQPKPIKDLLTSIPRGRPVDSAELSKIGVSPALAYHYTKSGWLTRLGRGVFMFSNDTLRQEDCLLFLSKRVRGFHVGGKTALAWRGIRHNLPAREPLALWGGQKTILPTWFSEQFPSRYTARRLFSTRLGADFGLQSLPETPDGVLVSTPERALLEMLGEVGVNQGIEEAKNIMEGARSLRPEVLGTLLKHCQRVKVILLCVAWARDLNLPWGNTAREAVADRIKGKRWTNRLKDGSILTINP